MAAAAGASGLQLAPTGANAPMPAATGVANTTSSAASSALSKKVQKALSQRFDSVESRTALKSLSGFFAENTVHSRRNLRSAIEGQNLLLHQEFVESFGGLESQLQNLEQFIDALDTACGRASSELARSREETHSILSRAASLQSESQMIDEKQEVLSKFLSKFQLSEHDTQAMKSGDHPIDNEFFDAFGKLEQVRENARQMLNACGQQTSGVDILHETSEILEACYERMFVWVRQECHTSTTGVVRKSAHELDSPAGAVLRRALTMLVDRPVYFNHCIKDVMKVRKQALVQRFFEALSQGDMNSGARPIELQAYDPVRYVGDMLAWIHENAAAEREALAALMGKARSLSSSYAVDASNVSASGEHATVDFDDILNQTLESLVSPFSARCAQVFESTTVIVTMYKVAQVFSFFANTLEEVLRRKDSCLVDMCLDLHEKAQRSFLDLWDAQSLRLRQGATGVYVSELSAPRFITESVNTLSEILSIYQAALVPEEEREHDFLPILSAAFDPLLNHCKQVAAMMDLAEGQIFVTNCVSAMQAPLRGHPFTKLRVDMYDALLEEYIKILIEGQAQTALSKIGLAECLRGLRLRAEEAPLNSVPELHPVSLSNTLRTFYNSLFVRGGVLALPLFDRITDVALRAKARSGVSKVIGDAYEELYTGIKELDVATHTPEQVRTLLD